MLSERNKKLVESVFGDDTGPLYVFGRVFPNTVELNRLLDAARAEGGAGDVEGLGYQAVFNSIADAVWLNVPDSRACGIAINISVKKFLASLKAARTAAGLAASSHQPVVQQPRAEHNSHETGDVEGLAADLLRRADESRASIAKDDDWSSAMPDEVRESLRADVETFERAADSLLSLSRLLQERTTKEEFSSSQGSVEGPGCVPAANHPHEPSAEGAVSPDAARVRYLEDALAAFTVKDQRLVLDHSSGGRVTLWRGQNLTHLAGTHAALTAAASQGARHDG